jgi:predicted solute-binding protein
MDAGVLSPGLMWPGRKVGHAPVSSAEVLNEGSRASAVSLCARSGRSVYFSVTVSSLPEKDVGEIAKSAKSKSALYLYGEFRFVDPAVFS